MPTFAVSFADFSEEKVTAALPVLRQSLFTYNFVFPFALTWAQPHPKPQLVISAIPNHDVTQDPTPTTGAGAMVVLVW